MFFQQRQKTITFSVSVGQRITFILEEKENVWSAFLCVTVLFVNCCFIGLLLVFLSTVRSIQRWCQWTKWDLSANGFDINEQTLCSVCVCSCTLTHLRLCSEVCSDKVRGKKTNSLVCFSFPPVGVTRGNKTMFCLLSKPGQFSHPLYQNQ